MHGADAGTASPGAPPTNAAYVEDCSEIPRLGTEDGASYDEPVGSSMMGDAVPEDGVLGLHDENNSEDDNASTYFATDSSEPRCPSSDPDDSHETAANVSPSKRQSSTAMRYALLRSAAAPA